MKKKNIILAIAIIVLALLLIFVVFLGEKKLDIASNKVTNLHNSLGEVDINKCGGLITYSDKTITENDLEVENRLCKAYHNIKSEDITSEIIKSTEKNKNNIKICKVGESTTLTTTNELETECDYQIIEEKALKQAYKEIYGNEIPNQDSFYISDKEVCYKEGEKYYCGNAENYKISIAPETSIYRIINKAIEKINGEIVIYDYFLKISNNMCYSKNNNEENKECSEELKNIDLTKDEETISLVKKYGAVYKHTFKKDKNKNHYWYKTELK